MIFLSEYHNTLKIGILTIIFLKKCVTRQKKRIFVVDFHIMKVFGNLRVFQKLEYVVIAVRLKVFDVVCFAFLVTIAINAMFESVFEMQMGIIFFCFFWQVFFQKNMGEQDTLSPQVIQDIKF